MDPSTAVGVEHEEDAASSAPPAESTVYASFLAASKTALQAPLPTADRPQDWADPDPDAGNKLPQHLQPMERAVGRWKSDARTTIRSSMRLACEMIQGLEPKSLSVDEARRFAWHHITTDDAADYRRAVYKRYTPQSTRNDKIVYVRGVVKACATAGLISPVRRDLLLDELYTVTPGRSGRKRRLEDEEMSRLMTACSTMGTPKARARNTAIVALLRTSGMRIGELVKIDLIDWDRKASTILLRDTKNGTDHLVFLHPAVVPLLDCWISLRGPAPGALFCSVTNLDTAQLSKKTLDYMLHTRATAANIPHFTMHDFRRTFATALLRTHDHALVSRLLNHRKLSSTLVYDLVDDDMQRDAIASFDLPFEESSPAGDAA